MIRGGCRPHFSNWMFKIARPLLLMATLAGLTAGIGAFTFDYGEGLSYFSTDPRACANCHIMNDQYNSWTKGLITVRPGASIVICRRHSFPNTLQRPTTDTVTPKALRCRTFMSRS